MTRTGRDTASAGVLLAATTTLVFRHWLFEGEALYWGDAGLYFFPMMRFLREQTQHGVFPLWNPLLFSGVPFVGNPQVWPLYPGVLLLGVLPASAFLTVSCVLHVFLAGLFCFCWLRRGRAALSFWPALLGAIGYMFGGYLVAKAQYPNMLQALAYVPLVLWLTEGIVRSPGPGSAIALGTALGLQLLAAHAQITLYTLYLALFYGAFCLLFVSTKKRLGLSLASAAGAGLVALGLSCGQWLPVLAARQLVARQALPLEVADRLRLSPIELSNFWLPWRYGSPLRGDYVGPSAFWETACYAGTLTLLLAIIGLVYAVWRRTPQRPDALFWLGVFVAGTWLATGARGGLFRLAYAVVPGFKFFHDPARLLIGAAVALPVLAGMGLEVTLITLALARRRRAMAWVGPLVVLVTALDLGGFDNGLYPLLPVSQLENPVAVSPIASVLRADPAMASGAGRLLTLDDMDADNQFLNWTDFRPPPRYLGRLTDTMLPNLPMAAGLNSLGGYEPLALQSSGALPLLATELLDEASAVSHDRRSGLADKAETLLGFMSVRMVVTFRPPMLRPLPGLVPIAGWRDGSNAGTVYRCDGFVPRARLYSSWQTVTGAMRPLDVARAWVSPQADPALLDQPWVQGSLPIPDAAPSPPRPAKVIRDTPDRVTLAVPASPQDALCILADTDFPGWQATLGGRPVPVREADGVYRAVFVPPSAQVQSVGFRYRPEAFAVGFYVTGVTVAFFAAFWTVSWMRRLGS